MGLPDLDGVSGWGAHIVTELAIDFSPIERHRTVRRGDLRVMELPAVFEGFRERVEKLKKALPGSVAIVASARQTNEEAPSSGA